MLTNNSSTLPLAQGVRYSENGQFLALGDGLWETLGKFAMPGVDAYAARFSDPSSGTAAYWDSRRNTKPLEFLHSESRLIADRSPRSRQLTSAQSQMELGMARQPSCVHRC
jgi:hypothetical protein